MSGTTGSEMIDLVMIGGGNMGAALLGGMINSGAFPWSSSRLSNCVRSDASNSLKCSQD